MKIGDKLLCKKQRGDTLSAVLKGKWYSIIWIGTRDIDLIGESGKEICFKKDKYNKDYYNLSDYFYSEREILNMKLKKNNEN